MSEIKTIEHYIVDRLETLEEETITLRALRDFYRELADEAGKKLKTIAALIEIATVGESELELARLSVYKDFETKEFEFLKSIKEEYGVQVCDTVVPSNEKE